MVKIKFIQHQFLPLILGNYPLKTLKTSFMSNFKLKFDQTSWSKMDAISICFLSQCKMHILAKQNFNAEKVLINTHILHGKLYIELKPLKCSIQFQLE